MKLNAPVIARIVLFGFVLGLALVTMMPVQAAAPAAVVVSAKATEAAREQRIEWLRDAKFGRFIHWGTYFIGTKEMGWNHPANRASSSQFNPNAEVEPLIGADFR